MSDLGGSQKRELQKKKKKKLCKWQEELKHFIPKMPRSVSHSNLPQKRQKSSCFLAMWRWGVAVPLCALQQVEEQEMKRNRTCGDNG